MARKRRSKADRAGDALTYLHNTASRLRSAGEVGNADRVDIGTDSLTEVLNNSGLACFCDVDYTSHGHKYSCRCQTGKSKATGLSGVKCRDSQGIFVPVPQCRRTKRKTVPKGLSGVHCRDSQGEFVPVPQCRRRKTR